MCGRVRQLVLQFCYLCLCAHEACAVLHAFKGLPGNGVRVFARTMRITKILGLNLQSLALQERKKAWVV